MAVTIYYENDVDPKIIQGKKVAIIGYGSQGHAHALNLQGFRLPMSSSACARVPRAGTRPPRTVLRSTPWPRPPRKADIVMMLVNDERAADIYRESVADNLEPGNALAFAHGFNIRYKLDRASRRCGRVHGCPQGPRPHRPRPVRHRPGRALPGGCGAGCHRQLQEHRSGLHRRHRRRPCRYHGDHHGYRDRDRPVRRADRPLRRPGGPDAVRLRGALRGRLRPRERLL